MANSGAGTGKKPEKVEPEQESGGQYLLGYCDGVPNVGSCEEDVGYKESEQMLAVIDAGNMRKALARVRANRGAAGVDGMTVEQLPEWLKSHWVTIRSKLLEGSYQPQAVKRVAIPKPDGGERILGIPTVLDRLIQQAISQVLTLTFDPHFSEQSYGFRPRRSARQAVREAQSYQHEGKRWVVDLDLEKFFDMVNHDILMGCLRKRVEDSVEWCVIKVHFVDHVMVSRTRFRSAFLTTEVRRKQRSQRNLNIRNLALGACRSRVSPQNSKFCDLSYLCASVVP